MFLPEVFNDIQLFTVICNISYCGDVRSKLKLENLNKVRNIVEPNIEHFRNLYESVINDSPFVERTDYGYCQAPRTDKNLRALEKLIPAKLLHVPEDGSHPKTRVFKFDDRLETKHQLFRKVAAGDYRYPEEQLKKVMFIPSINQTIKGFFTAGASKSFRYGLAKWRKSKPKSVEVVKKNSPDLPAVVEESKLMSHEYNIYWHSVSAKNPSFRNNVIISVFLMVSASLYVMWRESGYQKAQGDINSSITSL